MRRGVVAALGAWLDRVPLGLLGALAAWMALAPVVPEPHLWQKLKMLAAGTLSRPLDVFDLVFHAAPSALLAWRLLRRRGARRRVDARQSRADAAAMARWRSRRRRCQRTFIASRKLASA